MPTYKNNTGNDYNLPIIGPDGQVQNFRMKQFQEVKITRFISPDVLPNGVVKTSNEPYEKIVLFTDIMEITGTDEISQTYEEEIIDDPYMGRVELNITNNSPREQRLWLNDIELSDPYIHLSPNEIFSITLNQNVLYRIKIVQNPDTEQSEGQIVTTMIKLFR